MVILGIHTLAAAAFIGGMACYLWVYQAVPLPGKQDEILRWRRSIEMRFRSFRWACLLILLGTGVLNLVEGGVAERIASSFGGWLLIKLLLVVVLFFLSGIYDFVLREGRSGGKTRMRPLPLDTPLRSAIGYAVMGTAVGILIVAGQM